VRGHVKQFTMFFPQRNANLTLLMLITSNVYGLWLF
jgi:hypothetical protein